MSTNKFSKSSFNFAMTRRKRKYNQKPNEYIQQFRQNQTHQNAKKTLSENEPRAKKPKMDTEEKSVTKVSVHQGQLDMSEFKLKRIINLNASKKEITLLGEFEGYEGLAIVILEKKISEQWPLLQMEFFDKTIFTKKVFINNAYGDYECFPKHSNRWKMVIIHPASQAHLDKYAKPMEKVYLVNETYETYDKITKPYIESEALSHQWVNGILDGKAEQERIIHEDVDEDKGFVLLPDMKWNGSLKKLNMLVISRKKIKSLRDLNGTHLPLLKNIRDTVIFKMKERYNLPASQFKMTVHYLPSYYHFHVLVSNMMFKNQGEHLLSTVINNIEMVPDYYQRSELSFFVKESHVLYKKYLENGIIEVQIEA